MKISQNYYFAKFNRELTTMYKYRIIKRNNTIKDDNNKKINV